MNIDKAIQSAFVHYRAGNLCEAESICKIILEKHPDNIHVLQFLGAIYYQLGKYDSAINCITQTLQLDPANFEGLFNLGCAFQMKGELDKAIFHYREAIRINPDNAGVYFNLGVALQDKGLLDEAISCYKKALKINPNFTEVYNNLGYALKEKKQFDEAIVYLKKAIQLNPNLVDAYNNLGITFRDKGHPDEAISCFKKAIQINPAFEIGYHNLGATLHDKGQLDEAIPYFKKAIHLNPNYADAHVGISLAFLLSGNLKEGWKEHEWRWETERFFPIQRNFYQPLWKGENISGRTILLHAEQGFGDTIQFIRYAPLIAHLGATVIVECPGALRALLENVEGVKQAISQGNPLPDFDYHCPLLSLPLFFDTTLENIPAQIPYITADKMIMLKWHKKIQQDNARFKIGLVWAGSPKYGRDQHRSSTLKIFSSLAQFDNITFYNLQKGEPGEQAKNPPEGMKLIDFIDEINDFSDTAALIENLDLVISVDTAVAHLAGALGKLVWTLIPFPPDWRWMVNREDSPWYPTMRLFRQPSPGDWESVMEKILIELNKKIATDGI